ncbi:NAD(P)-dependent alcohol dehydrogenase [Nocardiopsis halophila]|uniref:NAD(P)-dependent alcohol dehydrogenase n=1 Tax=Nocardiopsis halophila TaxID=141692 RepID=UPI00034BFE15|nr:alcohol dehydrogenase catalytic domain-containing protein [Nocardiopsis halophila]
MRAVQYVQVGQAPVVNDVPVPEPGPGQVLLKVTAAGVCHSDVAVMSWPADAFPFRLPLTLGHEAAGVVEAVGENVSAVAVGESVVVYGPWGCGACRECSRGMENYCARAEELGIHPPGLGAPGALAEYVLIDDQRHLVPIGDLDPVRTVPLTDAGLTPYHAIKRAQHNLYPGATAVVIGVGGLGHVAVQLLRAMTGATVVALDVREESLKLAEQIGAHHALRSDTQAPGAVRDLTGGAGANAVFDFVGAQATVELAAKAAAKDSSVNIVGIGGGALPVGFGAVPYGTAVETTYWGGRSELIELIDLARQGAVGVHVERYGIEQGPEVYERMEEGRIQGRAVVVP